MPRPKKYLTEEDRIQAKRNASKKYRENNVSKINEYNQKIKTRKALLGKLWRYKNKEKKQLMDKLYREQNKEKIKNIKKDYYNKNYTKIRQYDSIRKKIKWATSAEFRNKLKIYKANNNDMMRKSKAKWEKTDNGKIFRRLAAQRRIHRKKNIKERILSKSQVNYLFIKFNHKCFNCGSIDRLSIDHHYPLSKGNALTINNSVLLCKSCNSKKSAKLPEFFYSPEQLTDLQLNYGITKQPLKIVEQPSLFPSWTTGNLERENDKVQAMNAA